MSFKCSSCNQIFSSKNELTKHIKFSTGNCGTVSDIIQCHHCGKDFTTQKGLSNHISMNAYCSALEDPQKMSVVQFPKSAENSHSRMKRTHHIEFDIQESSALLSMKRCKLGQQQRSEKSPSSMIVMNSFSRNSVDDKIQYSLEEMKCFFFQNRYQTCQNGVTEPLLHEFSSHPDLRVSFGTSFIMSHPRIQLSPDDQYLMDILTRRTKFSDPCVFAPFSVVVMDLMNNVAITLLEDVGVSIPGHNAFTTNISQNDVTSFVLRYSTFWVPRSCCLHVQQPPMGIATDANELVTIEDYVELEEEQLRNDEDEVIDSHDDNEDDLVFEQLFDPEEPQVEVNEVVDDTLKTYQTLINNTRAKSMYNCNDMANLELYQMVNSSGAPAFLFNQIQDWASNHFSKVMVGDGKKLQKRKTFVENMAHKVYGREFSQAMKPCVKVAQLPSGNKIEVVLCSFKAQIVSLLSDQKLMTPENLLLDPNNPFAEAPDGILSDLNSGWWYKETRQEVCSDLRKHILLPVVMFLDASNVDKNGRLQVNPLTFTLGIFKRSVRNLASAWRTIGYLDDQLNYVDKDVRHKLRSDEKVQDVHSILSLILNEYKELQGKNGGFSWTLDLGDKQFEVVFKLAVQVVIGDCKGNDVLCGRFGSHSLSVKRLCRDCDVLTLDGDNCDHICRYITRNDVENKSKDHLKDLSHHCIRNAFSDVYFGARNLCIAEASPPEPLHGYRLGICKYLFEAFETQCSNNTLKLVNFTVMKIATYSCRSSLRNLPSLQPFKRKGVTRCNTLSADEQFARTFALYLALMIPKVFQSVAIEDRHRKQTCINSDGSEVSKIVNIGPLGFAMAKKWLKLLSNTVTFHGWIMSPQHARMDLEVRETRQRHDRSLERESKAQKSVREYMRLYKSVINRTQGNGLRIPKFHQLLHYVNQILKDGSLLNIDGGRCESIATTNHTNPGKRTQMRLESFLTQLSQCHYADVTVNSASENSKNAYGSLTFANKRNVEQQNDPHCFGGTRFILSIDNNSLDDSRNPTLKFVWQGKQPSKCFSQQLCSALSKRLWLNDRHMNCLSLDSSVLCATEYYHNDITYRAHPSYRDDGAWFDWAAIAWEGSGQSVPAKLFMFLDLRSSEFEVNRDQQHEEANRPRISMRNHPDLQYLKKEMYVVIQTSLEDFEDLETNHRYRSKDELSRRIRLEQSWRIVPVTSITAPVFVIPEDETQMNMSTIDHFWVREKLEWPGLFLS